ncbi:MAG: hypothetical protein BWY43_00465 [candidate division WS2 bacterium ADurb.Bin280]|uniref:Baseplate protein J-like domain-containing protein n=1 Tax=candidate division WS2 bacterium ADurb.Bin280 TaxID=1852829 RepID=A0A1V5SE51_9BACT|nr:MAG: hypothetical protein BWY43_00465 [candidate division WS2 bacterium ADurb.Bin280]
MDEFLYLEADEEITSVIDKLKGLETASVGLVIPKGSMIAQSLVSLKLLQKEAKKLSKKIAIVTSDEVGRNLAAQVGLDVYSDVKSRTPLVIKQDFDEDQSKEPIEIDSKNEVASEEKTSKEELAQKDEAEEFDRESLPKEFTIHRYDEDDSPPEKEEEPPSDSLPASSVETPSDASPQPSEEEFVKRPVGDLKQEADRHEQESARPIRYEDIKNSRTKRNRVDRRRVIYIAVASIAFLALLLLTDLLIARLVVTIKVDADEINKNVELVVEKDRKEISASEGIIPGTLVSKESEFEKTISSSGEKNVGEKAKGIVVFKNESGVDEEIAGGTSLKSSNSVEFTLDSSITVPKATLNSAGDKVLGQASGAITAKEAGAQANMSSSTTYAIVGKSKITVSGSTSGGVTKKVKIVTKSDIERGKSELQDANKDKLINDAKSENQGKTFLDEAGTVELTEYSVSKSVDDEADNFVAKGKLRYSVLVFDVNDLREAAFAKVESDLEGEKGLVKTESDEVNPSITENQINVGKMKLSVDVKSHVGPKIDIARQSLALRAKPLKTVKQKLGELEGVEIGQVNLSPSWVLPISPILKSNIKINVEYSSKNASGN